MLKNIDFPLKISSISTRVFIIAVFLMVVLVFIVSLATYYVQYQITLKSLQNETVQIKDRIANAILEPVWFFSYSLVDSIMRTEIIDRRIQYIILWDEQGNVFWGLERLADGTIKQFNVKSQERPLSKGDKTLFAELKKEGYRLGILEIGFSYATVFAKLKDDMFFIFLGIVGITLIELLVLLYYLRRIVIKPILYISSVVHSFREKHFDARITLIENRADEIGVLSRTFNEMAELIEQYSSELESLVKERTARLIEAEKLAVLGSLTAGVAHEVNTPVGVSLTAATHLMERLETVQKLSAESKLTRSDFERFLNDAGETIGILITNLHRASDFVQSFKQIAVDQNKDDFRTINLREYIGEIIFSLRPKLKKTPHTVNLEVPADLFWTGYPGMLSQIITNLLINALMHAYPDGQAGEISIRAYIQNDKLILQFADDGCGIPEEDVNKIFEPFYTTKRDSGGSGLGLFIISNIVSRLGGSISVSSKIKSGTTFTIELPLVVTELDGDGNEHSE
ncbi:MAG TPA: ATP-binding protein [Spirochaetia bacterium]|nr:ATP-binding protein [Spirochaetales bacterium]HRS64820.1 ATP-binding protein [Spirochaetia bacterium]HOT58294.1 ATP-binding protein [Spirochaetales bacterium]HPD81305.1 ATP-binding protein [Spirochaetales bacterium]HQK33406.1 ATP-binding protein [Spirochaetales bacterium]